MPLLLTQRSPDRNPPPQMAAERFHLESGEALLIDNLRMLHGREGYSSKSLGNDRKMWRVWAWTDRTDGLPEGMKEIGSPMDASEVR